MATQPVLTKVEQACRVVDEKHMKMFIQLADLVPDSIFQTHLWWETYGKGLNDEIRWLTSRGLLIEHPDLCTLYRTRD